ncbi:MAG: hypothetical protein S0880_09215 [Actinomycetota bacterium]|nr:hypothetical protein [Actinomycetota bacterium]
MSRARQALSAIDPGRGADEGAGLIRLSWAGTVVFVITAIAAVVAPSVAAEVAAGTALALFGVGCVLFLWAFLLAVERSRTDAIGIGGLYFLAGSAPSRVTRLLMGSFAVEVVVALASASARPFTSLAFGVLVPMWGLGIAGLWGARYGTFEPRAPA